MWLRKKALARLLDTILGGVVLGEGESFKSRLLTRQVLHGYKLVPAFSGGKNAGGQIEFGPILHNSGLAKQLAKIYW